MAPNQTVTLEGMKTAQGHVTEAEGTSRNVRSTVEGELQTLRASWTGDAANKFQQAGEALLSHVDAVNKGLAGLNSALNKSEQEYSKTHNTTTDNASTVHSQVSSAPNYQGLPI